MVYATLYMKITDKASLDAYRAQAQDALARHGGKVLAASPAPTVLDKGLPAPDIAGVLSFPDRASAIAWYEDPALQPVHDLRRNSGECSVILVG